jgi:trimeric autotransporter adhesin
MRKIIYIVASLFLLLSARNSSAQISGNWKLVGPIQFPYDSSWWQINGIGRIEQIKFDPMNPLRVYATSSGGGLFVSNDSTFTWNSTGTDSAAFGNTSGTAASVCIDYTNDNILYLGTGDANYYSENYGIWKSTDAGATWNPANTGIGNRLAVEILMSPLDHNTLIAATDDGIWKTTNGGSTWIEKHVGDNFTDMQFKPHAITNTLYAASYDSFYVSNDMGETWKKIALPGPVLSLQGGGRIGITKADTDMVYLTYVGNDSVLCTPLLKSDNSGLTFKIVKPADSCDLNGYDSINFGQYYQGNYNYCIIVSPTDTNTIYISAESCWKSTDGGVHWATNYGWWEGVHCDMHYFAFNPLDPSILYNANDGGVWKTTDGAGTWVPVSNGLSTSECYHASSSPINKNFIVAGLQDNGGILYDAPVSQPWDTYVGGDFTDALETDYADSTIFYDLRSDYRQQFITNGWTLNLPQRDSTDYNLIAFSPTYTNTAFIADSEVYRTTDLTTNPPTWTKISNINQPFAALAVSPYNPNVVYAADQNGNFHYTKNALSATPTWHLYSAPASTSNGACIAAVKSDTNVVYMSCGSSVYRSENRGVNWTNVTYNLPAVNIINLYNDVYTNNQAMYLATGDAVWYKDSTMTTWLNYSKGLPNTCWITSLMMYNDGTTNSVVRVSFYGRGVWESPTQNAVFLGEQAISGSPASLKVYPNPNNGSFTVSLNNSDENAQINIYNLLGQNVYTSKLNKGNTVINLNTHTPGMYLYKVYTKTGEFISSGKLIVE